MPPIDGDAPGRLVDALRTELDRQRQLAGRWNGDVKEHRGSRQMSGMGVAAAEAEVGLVLLAINGVALVKADSERKTLCQLTQVAAQARKSLTTPATGTGRNNEGSENCPILSRRSLPRPHF